MAKKPLPPQVNFEALAKHFMTLASERYPSADKVLSIANKLGIQDSVPLQIAVFSQYRDIVREVPLERIYKTVQHRDEVYQAIIEALEILEDKYEEMLNEEEE